MKAVLFSPAALGPIELRNRTIRAGAFEGMTPKGQVSERLIEYHRTLARGEVGLTTVAYCSVTRDGLTFEHQLCAENDIEAGLKRLAEAVHAEGGRVALQIGHAGFFANPHASGGRPIGPDGNFCLFNLTRARRAAEEDLRRLVEKFARAAELVRRAGFDAVELHLGHGYLLSQFLSPATNRRRDVYGGSLENRLRFPLEVLRAVRQSLGPELALVVKFNVDDGFRGGLRINEAIEVARALERAGADALEPSGGFVSRTPFYMLRGKVPVREFAANEKNSWRRLGLLFFGRFFVRQYPYHDLFFLEQARQILAAVKIPVIYLGGVRRLEQIEQLFREGFFAFALARPLIKDPYFVARLRRGEIVSSDCQPCNLCVAEMEKGGIRCPLNS